MRVMLRMVDAGPVRTSRAADGDGVFGSVLKIEVAARHLWIESSEGWKSIDCACLLGMDGCEFFVGGWDALGSSYGEQEYMLYIDDCPCLTERYIPTMLFRNAFAARGWACLSS